MQTRRYRRIKGAIIGFITYSGEEKGGVIHIHTYAGGLSGTQFSERGSKRRNSLFCKVTNTTIMKKKGCTVYEGTKGDQR